MSRSSSYDGPKCSDVADKLGQIFGWRQTYNVEKLQKNLQNCDMARISIIRSDNSKVSKGTDSWVSVRNLQSQGGGILDPDDRLSDVVDDREQIFVSFESDDGVHHHVGGDGASVSSDGTGSPELFKDFGYKYGYHKFQRSAIKSKTDIEVTGVKLANGSHIVPTLQVRRGSEPNLTQIDQHETSTMGIIGYNPITDHTKRWSAAPLIVDSQPTQQSWQQDLNSISIGKSLEASQDTAARLWRLSHDSMLEPAADETMTEFTHLPRNNTNRLSIQFTCDGIRKNLTKSVERTYNSKYKMTSTSLPRDQKRKEPLGQANSATSSPTSAVELELDRSEVIVIRNDKGPLGIHVIPDYDRHGMDRGLLVQGIDADGRVFLDGRIALYDRIIEINGQSLLNLSFQRVQEMFKLSLTSPELSLRIIKVESSTSRKIPPPVYPRLCDNKENISKLGGIQNYDTTNMKIATVSPTKKLAAASRNQKSLLTVNTRKIGRKIELQLIKAPPPHGLGFSITTRDNPAGGNCPIYIKNIIPKGAAIQDGRLKIGDRLLEVNDVEMTGKSQSEAVSVLRNVSAGSKVRIVVSRQEDVPNSEPSRNIDVDTTVNRYAEPSNNEESDGCYNDYRNAYYPNSNLTSSTASQALHHLLHQPLIQNRSTPNEVANSVNFVSDIYTKPLDIYGDISSFPWTYKEILTLDIPVHDSEKAGLGISVKGKTSGQQDLGIFIKSVIHGGAASRDRRLRTNDQLLNVNNISLLYQSNSDAMETLRKAMLHTEGPVPGNITLTIARKALPTFQTRLQQNAFLNRSFHDYLPASNHSDLRKSNKTTNGSLDSSSINGELEIHEEKNSSHDDFSIYTKVRCKEDFQRSSNYIPDSTAKRGIGSMTTVIFNPKHMQNKNAMNTWNPVLDKLAGESNNQLRNDSYYKATNQCDTSTHTISREPAFNNVIKTPFGETYLMEDEYGLNLPQNNITRKILLGRPYIKKSENDREPSDTREKDSNEHFTNLIGSSTETMPLKATCSLTSATRKDSGNVVQAIYESLVSQNACIPTEAIYVSQLSLRNPPTGFSRDAFGRQSMSEKRHAALDAKNTDTYQRSKKMREKRGRNKTETDMLDELGPSLGMKKSSSLESLQTMVQETQMKNDDSKCSYPNQFGGFAVFRGENSKATFLTVDGKSSSKNVMDPDHQTKISAKKHWLLDPPTDLHIPGFEDCRGARQSSLNSTTSGKTKHARKKSTLLKGIGTMFR